MPSDTITFAASHVPPLRDGLHTLKLTHEVHYGDVSAPQKQSFVKTHNLFVRGERFALRPEHIHKVFPPMNAVGDFDSVLPHVMLSRKTLPWEREVVVGEAADGTSSWLAVLVFAKDEAPKLVSGTVGDLQQSSLSGGTYSYGSVYEPLLQNGSGESLEDVCAYVDIPAGLFNASAPTLADMLWNAHARKRDHDYAVVIGAQLCPPGTTAVAHLVSLEGLGGILPGADGTSKLTTDITTVRLVSLKSWSFRALPLQESFADILAGLNQHNGGDSMLRLPRPDATPNAPLDAGYTMLAASGTTYASLPIADTTSWYRGPLMPWSVPPVPSLSWPKPDWLPVDHAELLSAAGTTDGANESYAAAWQLGRLLALADKGYAVAQVGWKRDLRLQLNVALRQKKAIQSSSRQDYATQVRNILASADALKSHLPVPEKVPEEVMTWLGGLAQMKGVPFHYLVPDAHMLPPESIRFFNVDQLWLDALLDGAWSLGREPVATWAFDTAFQPWRDAKVARPRSGLLIQSRLISGYWPGIDFIRSDSSVSVREERLGPTTLLLLFDHPWALNVTLTVQEPPEGIHFGFDAEDTNGLLTLSKKLKADDGSPAMDGTPPTAVVLTDIPFRPRSNVLDLAALAAALETALETALGKAKGTLNAAEFALQMTQGVPKVPFQLTA